MTEDLAYLACGSNEKSSKSVPLREANFDVQVRLTGLERPSTDALHTFLESWVLASPRYDIQLNAERNRFLEFRFEWILRAEGRWTLCAADGQLIILGHFASRRDAGTGSSKSKGSSSA